MATVLETSVLGDEQNLVAQNSTTQEESSAEPARPETPLEMPPINHTVLHIASQVAVTTLVSTAPAAVPHETVSEKTFADSGSDVDCTIIKQILAQPETKHETPKETSVTASQIAKASPRIRPIREELTSRLIEQLHATISGRTIVDRESPSLAWALMADAWRERATDVHVEPLSGGARVRFRIDGVIIDAALLSKEQSHRLINQCKTLAKLDPMMSFVPLEARWKSQVEGNDLDLRLTTAPCVAGEKMAIRVLDPRRMQRLPELGLSNSDRDRIEGWLASVNGMFLVTGPTGSGKTTTLYALLHELKDHDRSVATIEDPVEYQIDNITQMQIDERHGLTFAKGLKTMLRLDPDCLMLGEIRDQASARAAMDASISGRVLMSTLHSRDAVSSISALRNWGIRDHEIAVSLSLVIAQRLVRKLCEKCRTKETLTELQRNWLQSLGLTDLPREIWNPKGCAACHGQGYFGRTGVFELWRLDEEDYNLILEHSDEHAIRRREFTRGSRPLVLDGLTKVARGITSLDELRTIVDLDTVIPEGSCEEISWSV